MSAATFYNFSRGDKYMSRGRKQVAFDLDTTALKTYYPSDNWNYAYEVIRRHMTNSGFLSRFTKLKACFLKQFFQI